jgi:hypothetical protein
MEVFQHVGDAFDHAAADQCCRLRLLDGEGFGVCDIQIDSQGKPDGFFEPGFTFAGIRRIGRGIRGDFRMHDDAAFALRTPIYAAASALLTHASSAASSFSGSNNWTGVDGMIVEIACL